MSFTMISTTSIDEAQKGYIIDMTPLSTGSDSEYIYYGFGGLIKILREKLGLSQKELAAALDQRQNTVSNWESRTKPVNKPLVLMRLAEFFDIEVEDLEAGRLRKPELIQLGTEDDVRRVARRFLRNVTPDEGLEIWREYERLGPEARQKVKEQMQFYKWQEDNGAG